MGVAHCLLLGKTVQFELRVVAMESVHSSVQKKSSLRVLRRLLVNSVSAKKSWFMKGKSHS